MAGLVEGFLDLLNRSLDARFWAVHFLLLAAYMAGLLVSFVVVALPAYLAYLSFGFSATGIFSLLLLAVLFVFLAFSLTVLYSGTHVNVGKRFLEEGRIALRESFDETQNRFWSAFWMHIALFLFTLLLLMVCFFPLLLNVVSFLSSGNFSTESIAGVVLSSVAWLLLGLLIFFAIAFVIVPGTILLTPIVFFERVSVQQTIQRCIFLGKKNYWTNWGFYLIWVLFSLVVNIPLIVLDFSTRLVPVQNPVHWLLSSIYLLLYLALTVWLVSVSSMFYPKLYALDTVEEHQSAMKQLVQQTVEKHEFIVERHDEALKQKR